MRRLLLAIVFFCFAVNASAEDLQERWYRYVNSNAVNDLVYLNGNMWCATSGGIVRINPDNSDMFTFGYDRGVPDISCPSITVDTDGVLWAISGGKLIMLEETSWSIVEPEDVEYPDENTPSFYMVTADSEKGLWIATPQGVLRYDGAAWTFYTVDDGLPFKNVMSIAVGPDGRVWAGAISTANWKPAPGVIPNGEMSAAEKTSGDPSYTSAIALFDNGRWNLFKEFTATNLSGSVSIAAGPDGTLAMWRASTYPSLAEGLNWYDGSRFWYVLHSNHNIPSKGILSAQASPDGTWWVGTTEGLGRLTVSNDIFFDSYTTEDGLPSNAVSAIAFSDDGTLYTGTDHGPARYDGETWDTYTVPSIGGLYVKHAVEDTEGRMWFGTDNGLSCFDDGAWTTYTVADGLPSNYINALEVDSRGRICVCTIEGVARFDNGSWTSFDAGAGSSDNATMWVDDRDRIWVGVSPLYGLARIDGDKVEEMSRSRVMKVAHDNDGSFWAIIETNGVRMELFHYVNEELTLVKTLGNDNYSITTMSAHDGDVWLLRYNEVLHYDGESWSTYPAGDGLPARPTGLEHDTAGRVWCWSVTELSLFENGSWRVISPGDGNPDGVAAVFAKNGKHPLLIGGGDDMFSYENGSFVKILSGEDIPGRLFMYTVDSQGCLWIGTDSIIGVHDGHDFETYDIPFAANPWGYGVFMNDSRDRFWYSTLSYGVVRLDPVGLGVASGQPRPSTIECRNHPNPFNASTTISFTLTDPSDVSLDVYNITGQKIRTLAAQRMEAGAYGIRWDGRLDTGIDAASGVYIARLHAGNAVATRRMLLVK